MELNQALDRLQKDKKFSDWKSSRNNSYFSYAFKMPEEANDWQIGYYDKDKDRITTFIVADDSIEIKKDEEVFKKESMDVLPIEKEKIKIKLSQILGYANDFQRKNYPKDLPIKIIAILQNLKDLGTIWNITFITQTFNTLNMKIRASSGQIVQHKLSSIMSFRKS